MIRFQENHGLCLPGLKIKNGKSGRDKYIDTYTQEVSLGMNICLFKCMVYEVFVQKVLLEKVGFKEVTAGGIRKVLSPEVGRFRLAHMIQGFFCNASLKLWHAVQL